MRRAFTLVEMLVCVAIIAVLAAILFPVLSGARSKAHLTSCMNNQRQIALATIMYEHDHECFPAADSYWTNLDLERRLTICPKMGKAYGNAYVFNNFLSEKTMADVEQPELTAISADGKHDGDAWLKTYDNIAYQPCDLQRRHSEKFAASYVDGHVDLTDKMLYMSGKPGRSNILHWEDIMLWLSADRDTQYDPVTQAMSNWGDGSWQGLAALPLDEKHPPIYYANVPALGGQPAIFFYPPHNFLVTEDISGGWIRDEGTIFVVFLPTGNNPQYEYTVLDQSNGDAAQATRLRYDDEKEKKGSSSTNAPGGGGKPPKVTITATPVSISPGQSVTVTWSSTDATSVVTSSFGAIGVSGSMTFNPLSTTTYSITVANADGSKTDTGSVTVMVGGEDSFTGSVSWLRRKATMKYPPNNVPYDTATLWTLVSKGSSYTMYDKGHPWPAYAGGQDWRVPEKIYVGGSKHGSNANRRSFDGYVAEVIIYRTALSDADRQTVEKYLLEKYDL